FKQNGYKGILDYTTIPKATWFTSDKNRLSIKVGAEIVEHTYEVSADSMKITSERFGSIQYYVRK
ncbi:MAG: hypothetical protein ACI9ZX_001221, partial [Algoriphagus sp.]